MNCSSPQIPLHSLVDGRPGMPPTRGRRPASGVGDKHSALNYLCWLTSQKINEQTPSRSIPGTQQPTVHYFVHLSPSGPKRILLVFFSESAEITAFVSLFVLRLFGTCYYVYISTSTLNEQTGARSDFIGFLLIGYFVHTHALSLIFTHSSRHAVYADYTPSCRARL